MSEWRIIDGFSGYKVNEDGEILSLEKTRYAGRGYKPKTYPEKIVKGKKDKDGYLIMKMRNDEGEVKYPKKARLIAKAFPEICGEWFEGCVIDHINGVKDDNRACNLKVCTVAENNRNPITHEKWRKANENTNFGKGWSGHKHTEESKRKMSEIKRKRDAERKKIA